MRTHPAPRRRVAKLLGLAAAAATIVVFARRAFPIRVAGPSMLPTLEPGDLVACMRQVRALRRGDMVVIEGDPVVIKRVAAIGGERYGDELVQSGHLFVVGDNAAASTDSRSTGTVSAGDVAGVARAIYWPPRRVRLIR